jgi:quinol-cytochrome oxidoreductase complex cytochrome b subunit
MFDLRILYPAFFIAALILVAAVFGQKNVNVAYKRKRMTVALIVFVVTFIVFTIAGFLIINLSGIDLQQNEQWLIIFILVVSILISLRGSKRMIKKD